MKKHYFCLLYQVLSSHPAIKKNPCTIFAYEVIFLYLSEKAINSICMIPKSRLSFRITLFLSFLLVVLSANAQDSLNRSNNISSMNAKGDMILSLSPSVLVNTPLETQFASGFYFQLFLSPHFSVDADLMFGRDYAHFGPGTIVIPIWLLILATNDAPGFDPFFLGNGDNFKTFLGFLALTALSFEHVSLHFPMSESSEISPYLSLLRYKYASSPSYRSDSNKVSSQFCGAIGVHYNKYVRSFVISPYIEYNVGYTDKKTGINAGINCGFKF